MALSRRSALQAAEKLVSRGRLEAAVKQYRKALADSPDDTGTLNRLGDLYARLNRVPEAVEMFSAAAGRFTKDGFFVKAIAIYKKIIRLDPTLMKVYETLADLYHRQGLVNEARAQYQVVADYYRQGDDKEALVAVFEKMVDLEPGNPSHRLKLAEFYCGSGQIPEAMEQYQKIAQFMLEHDKVEEAFKVYLGAFELKVDDLGFLTDIIVQLTDRGHRQVAESLLAEAIERNPDAARVADLVDLPIAELPERRGGQLPADSLPGVDEGPPPAKTPEPEAASEAQATALAGEPAGAPPELIAASPPTAPVEDLAPTGLEPEVREFETRAEEAGVDETAEFEIPLDLLEGAEPESAESDGEPVGVGGSESPPAVDIETVELLEPESSDSRAEELVTEANVLSNYGLEAKAIELLERALRLAPANAEAVELLLHLHHQEDRSRDVVEVAQRFVDAGSLSPRLESLLQDWGFRIEDGRVRSSVERPEADQEVSIQPEPEPEAPVRVNWLDEEPPLEDVSDDDSLFGEEDDFFDLAAELEEELMAEESVAPGLPTPQVGEQSIEEIVEGFKQGVAEVLSTEDYDTHYNLGIAYREMGLVDEAIGEFQLAAKSEQYLVDCCSLLGASFLEKGFPDLAIKWFERGLKSPTVSDEEKLGLLYELGNLYLTTGERGTAKETFAEIYGANSNYRDVVAKLEELRHA